MNIKYKTNQYFFVLGNNPTLSIAEISAIFPNAKKEIINKDILIIKSEQDINPKNLIKKLGGTIKIGNIQNEITDITNYKNILICAKNLIIINAIKGKFKFGISYYGNKKINTNVVGMEIKKYLRGKKISCRWVTSKESTLSSVVVEQNKLTSKGIEIILIKKDNNILIGKTLSTQPFKEISRRDYGRPARDDKSGMIPPKLAQIMINLTESPHKNNKDTILLDPFCGSGTILTEAMLLGYKNIIGSDISQIAINDTGINIEWIKKNYECQMTNYKLIKSDIIQLSKFVKPSSVDKIITEPYLGPQRGQFNIYKTIQELEKLYAQSLNEFKKIIKKNGKIVMIWPIFTKKTKSGSNQMLFASNINQTLFNGFKIINPIPRELKNNKFIKLTQRNTIIYGREGQKIWREIIFLQKNN